MRRSSNKSALPFGLGIGLSPNALFYCIIYAVVNSSKIANGSVGSAQLADTVAFRQVSITDSGGREIIVLGDDPTAVGMVLKQTRQDQLIGVAVADHLERGLGAIGAGPIEGFGFAGLVGTTDPTTGKATTAMGGNRSSGGVVTVANSSGTATAGLAGSTGLVFGDTKSFIIPDPTREDRMIKYTSLEGPEAGIYLRGTHNLSKGSAIIEIPSHFSSISVPSSVTVMLTPKSANSKGLAAVDVSATGIRVQELNDGKGDYPFDYVVHAIRKGFEDYEVYLSKKTAEGLTGQSLTRSVDKVMSTAKTRKSSPN